MWVWAKYALRWVTKWSLFLPSYFSFKSDFNFLPVFLKEIPLLPFSISAKKGAKTSRDRSQIHSPSNITGIFLALWKHRYCKATSSLRIQSLKKQNKTKLKTKPPHKKKKNNILYVFIFLSSDKSHGNISFISCAVLDQNQTAPFTSRWYFWWTNFPKKISMIHC